MVSRRELSWNVRHTIRTCLEGFDRLLNYAGGVFTRCIGIRLWKDFCHLLWTTQEDFEPNRNLYRWCAANYPKGQE